MYQLLKCVRIDELVDQLKLLIRKLRMYSTEAPYELITDRRCTMNVYNSIWDNLHCRKNSKTNPDWPASAAIKH